MQLIAATNNRHKVQEFIEIFGGGYEIVCAGDIVKEFDPDETGITFEENAMIKAKAAYAATGLPSFADDSGICVDALGGLPGIHSARYAEPGKRKATLLDKMKDLTGSSRSAHFTCAFAYCDGKNEFTVEGKCYGHILHELTGSGGFGYDPIFYSDDLKKSFGEATSEEKNRISHRAKAIELFLTKLKQLGI